MNLSGGNQRKVLIGRSMEAGPRILIFDEPAKGTDVKTKEEIYTHMKRLAEENRVGIILISSELEELLKCSNKIVAMYNGRKLCEMDGQQLTMENLLSAFIVIFGASCFISPNILTGYNISIMVRTLAFIGIISIGQGLLLLLGDIDVSWAPLPVFARLSAGGSWWNWG